MNFDLRELLNAWPYDAQEPLRNLRKFEGEDGRPILQVREPIGIQQLEYNGRPDGMRPGGKSTWLDYYQEVSAGKAFFQLSREDCQRLMQEGVLFYQRYLILYQMGDWEGVVRDTERNLSYFKFLRSHAAEAEDWLIVEQYRPYVMRVNAIARGHLLRQDGRSDEALDLLRRTAHEIRNLEDVPTAVFKLESERSIKHLEELIEEYSKDVPVGRLETLKREQKDAIRREDFELAARLRDEIRRLEGDDSSSNN